MYVIMLCVHRVVARLFLMLVLFVEAEAENGKSANNYAQTTLHWNHSFIICDWPTLNNAKNHPNFKILKNFDSLN